MTNKDKILYFILKTNKPCKTSDIAMHSGLSAYQTRYYLMRLEKEGKISRSPLRRGASVLWEAIRKIDK
ncbi:TPA: dolichol monophosphate mannose synthase [Escherichia coli]|nr:dolichol monophosphate mannose synthase [Escherichia coli]